MTGIKLRGYEPLIPNGAWIKRERNASKIVIAHKVITPETEGLVQEAIRRILIDDPNFYEGGQAFFSWVNHLRNSEGGVRRNILETRILDGQDFLTPRTEHLVVAQSGFMDGEINQRSRVYSEVYQK